MSKDMSKLQHDGLNDIMKMVLLDLEILGMKGLVSLEI